MNYRNRRRLKRAAGYLAILLTAAVALALALGVLGAV